VADVKRLPIANPDDAPWSDLPAVLLLSIQNPFVGIIALCIWIGIHFNFSAESYNAPFEDFRESAVMRANRGRSSEELERRVAYKSRRRELEERYADQPKRLSR